MSEIAVHMTINDEQIEIEVDPRERLLDTLRDRLDLTGTKEGCGIGECGACTVIMDGRAVNACLVLTPQAQHSEIITIEGLKVDGELDPLQKSFIDHQAVQCGFCTPGMIMSARALLDMNPDPDREEIETALEGNLCRCTGYKQIVDAVEAAAAEEGE